MGGKTVFGPPACFSVVQGKQKLRGREERLPTSFLPNQVTCSPSPSLGRTKRICLDLEYKPCLESGNAPEGTSKNVLENLWRLCTNLSFYKWERDSQLPLPSEGSTFSQAGSSQNSCRAGPIQPEFFKTSFEKPLFQVASQLSVPLCCSSLMP